ncbi:MAG: hypothetical protein AAGM84_16100 [Pseudomonadota bacterium]
MARDGSIEARSERLRKALDAALGVRAKTLAAARRKAGRRLPRRVRASLAQIIEAEARAANPKLQVTLDHTALDRAEEDALSWLASVDRADARRGAWLSLAGSIIFNLLIVTALFIGWMVWADKI